MEDTRSLLRRLNPWSSRSGRGSPEDFGARLATKIQKHLTMPAGESCFGRERALLQIGVGARLELRPVLRQQVGQLMRLIAREKSEGLRSLFPMHRQVRAQHRTSECFRVLDDSAPAFKA